MKVTIIINDTPVDLSLSTFVKLVRLGCWFNNDHLGWNNSYNSKIYHSQWYDERMKEYDGN